MRVLLYSDDEKSRDATHLRLKLFGYNVTSSSVYEEAQDLAKLYEFDVIIIGSAPMAVTKALRTFGVFSPILAVFNHNDTDARIATLDEGADACLTSPVDGDEFLAVINALVRRSRNHATEVVACGDLSVNLARMQVSIRGKFVDFTAREYKILQLLALRRGSTVTREVMMNHLYGGRDEPDIKIIDVFVCKLRRKLRKHDMGDFVTTVWGRGYQLAA
jgi:two-component system, cell cycle response regulator CtrA